MMLNKTDLEVTSLKNIVVCEPLCWSAEHAEINAAILLSLCEAWREVHIVFLAEKSHGDAVKQVLSDFGYNIGNKITWLCLKLPERSLSNSRRVVKDWRVVTKVYQYVSFYKASSHVLFLSASSGILLGVKFQSRKQAQSWIVMHGGLDDLRKQRIRLAKPFYYGNMLCLHNQSDIRYLVLGQYIADHLPNFTNKLMPYVDVLEHPAIFPNDEQEVERYKNNEVLRFASIGVVSPWKNSEAFLKLAESVYELGFQQAHFCFIGALMDAELAERIHSSVAIAEMKQNVGEFLSRETMNDAIISIDYAVFLYDAEAYVLKASGVVLDAFRFAKPIIAIRCAMFEDFFERFGDIGYLCNDEDDLQQVIVDLIETPDPIRYQKQQQNILQQRDYFSISSTGKRFRRLWGNT